jgi:hypothetical protein
LPWSTSRGHLDATAAGNPPGPASTDGTVEPIGDDAIVIVRLGAGWRGVDCGHSRPALAPRPGSLPAGAGDCSGGDGIAYASVRRRGGENAVAFDPRNVTAVPLDTRADLLVPIAGKLISRRTAA